MLVCVCTGFVSGLPLYLLLNLLPAWLFSAGISLRDIGAMTLIQLPYTWKFLWAPLVDRYALPGLGRRRSWMLCTQVGLVCVIAGLGLLSPRLDLPLILLLTLALSLLSATQDIALDAFRREILGDAELGLGNAVHVNAYRIAGLVPGSLSLILADHLPWSEVFLVTALFLLPGMIMVLLVREPVTGATLSGDLRSAVTEPLREFLQRSGVKNALLILAFVFLYKLGDSLCTALATPFYLSMGYSKTEIGLVAKNAGLWPAVAGGLLGGLWMVRLGINRALWVFGLVQMLSILGFAWLAQAGPQSHMDSVELLRLGLVIGLEALGVGLGTAAFVAFIARATHPLYTATQFALFTSLAAIPRAFINAIAGVLVEHLGWFAFFLLCFTLAIPGMALLPWVAPWSGRDSQAH
ncbi:MAG: AmpG family muropeptide MFS transporter [Proteobacteria bacterium]|nr:AmpG family muropeptide MFS transporter [Pseudomonadota bacterium]